MITIDLVEGQTAPIYLNLLAAGAVPKNPDGTALTMAGMSCVFVVHTLDDVAVTITGPVTIESAASWQVKYSPVSGEHVHGRYRSRVKVTDAAGKIGYFPSDEWDRLIVRSD